MSKYKLSIIVPTFNLENKITHTFNSIKSQTLEFEDIEVIFIDDHSTDTTMKIIESFSDDYPNVKVFKTDANSGFAGKPRNVGLEKSTGKYILFLDGDDHLLVDSCEVLLKNIESDASDIAIGSHINRYDNGVLEHIPAMTLGGKEVFENSYDVNLLDMTPAISAKLFKKGFLLKNNIRFAEGIPAQDLVFLEEALLNSKKVTVLNNQYIYYRNIHKKSISYNITERYLFGMIEAYSALFDLFEMFKIEYNIQKAIFKRHLGFFTTQILRAKNLNILTDEKLEKILNSQEFGALTGKSAFDKLQIIQYFEFMRCGKYRDAQKIIRSINVNEINYLSLKEEKENLLKKIDAINEHNTTLTEQNNTINNKLIELQKDINSIESKTNDLTKENRYLQSENTNLKNELDEIKSKRLWELLNRI